MEKEIQCQCPHSKHSPGFWACFLTNNYSYLMSKIKFLYFKYTYIVLVFHPFILLQYCVTLIIATGLFMFSLSAASFPRPQTEPCVELVDQREGLVHVVVYVLYNESVKIRRTKVFCGMKNY